MVQGGQAVGDKGDNTHVCHSSLGHPSLMSPKNFDRIGDTFGGMMDNVRRLLCGTIVRVFGVWLIGLVS